jgi:hypothetical protein
MDVRYQLSNLIPIRFRTVYGTGNARRRATWIQWRGRVFRHQSNPV